MDEKRVEGYPFDEVRKKEELVFRTYEYDLPFNYPNVIVWRKECFGGEFHGMELFTRNQQSPFAQLTRAVPEEWTFVKGVTCVPPEAAIAELRLYVDTGEAGETVWIANAFAGILTNDWNKFDDVPAGMQNLAPNPTFAGGGMEPPGWRTQIVRPGEVTEECDQEGHAGLKLHKSEVVFHGEVPVKAGQRLVYGFWAKSTSEFPKAAWMKPWWKTESGSIISDEAGDCIVIEEDEPIVRVVVIGSACTPPGYVMLEAVPYEEFYRRGDMVRCTAPVRFRQNNLWGMHLRADQWFSRTKADFGYEEIPDGLNTRYPGIKQEGSVKASYQEFPFAGMSSAVFEIPKSKKVIIQGGSETPAWLMDNAPADDHYSFRTIRVTVASSAK